MFTTLKFVIDTLNFRENMDKKTAERLVQLMSSTSQIDTVDLTGKYSKWCIDKGL